MKPIVITLLLAVAAGPAAAEEPSPATTYRIDVPAGFTRLPDQAHAIAATLANTTRLGGLDLNRAVAAYADRQHRVSLVVTSSLTRDPSDHPDELLAAELAAAEDAWRTAALTPGETESLAWKLELSPTVADAHLDYRHSGNETITYVRSLLYFDAEKHLGSVAAECTMLEDGLEGAGPICRKALASLALTAGPLADLPEVPAAPPKPVADPEADDAGARAPTASLREASPDHPGVLVTRQPPPPDRSYRWLYLIGGILLVVAFYLTTRSRRTELDNPSRQRDDHDHEEADADAEPEPEAEPDADAVAEAELEDQDEEKKS